MLRLFRRRVHDHDLRHRRPQDDSVRSSSRELRQERHPVGIRHRHLPDGARLDGIHHRHLPGAVRSHRDADPGPGHPDGARRGEEPTDAGCRSARQPDGYSCPACSRRGCCPDAARRDAASPGRWRTGCYPDGQYPDAGYRMRRQRPPWVPGLPLTERPPRARAFAQQVPEWVQARGSAPSEPGRQRASPEP